MKIHVVKKGDTLYELAQKYGVELDQIIALNPQITDPDKIDVGMKVKIPSRPKPVEPPASEYVYKHIVQQGDSLWKLGKAWDIPLQAMIQANPQLKNPNVLMTGEVVYIPKLQGEEGPKVLPAPSPKPSTAPMYHAQPVGEATVIPEQPAAVAQEQPAAEPQEQPEAPMMEVPETFPAFPAETVGEAPESIQMPQWQPPAAVEGLPEWSMPALPTAPSPHTPQPEPMDVELSEPYQQAVHPFHQVKISATEVFAYQQEPGQFEYPSMPMASGFPSAPWETHHAGHMPVSDGGCGCGGSMTPMPEAWNAFPQAMPPFYPHMPAQMPAAHEMPMPYYPAMQHPAMMPQMGTPYTHGMGMMPHAEMPFHAGMGTPATTAGMPYPNPYESPILPQVETSETPEKIETKDVEVDLDVRSGKKGEKASGKGARKAKSSGQASISSTVKRQRIEKPEPRPNLPWINV